MKEASIRVRYVGKRPEWFDRLYGSGLMFGDGQARSVPASIAGRLLRHSDCFERVQDDAQDAKEEAVVTAEDDTQALLDEAEKTRFKDEQANRNMFDLRDQISLMEKDALKDFAFSNYQQKLDMRLSVENLRAQVNQFIDQFGVV